MLRSDAEVADGDAVDAAMQTPDWEGITLGPSRTTSPDGAVVSADGGITQYDADAAGPVLNPASQAACLSLAGNICGRSADCQTSLLQLTTAQRDQRYRSCMETFLRLHNCNRAVATASGFSACSEAVKTRDCLTIVADDFAVSCLTQVTFEP